ncbi:MAG: preprotein translocase subunit SecG [Candidatus Berkiellales bacterium]
MYEILLVFHVLIAIALIGLILLQQGKGAQTGAAFGSGASQTVFGSAGSGGFISRTTATLAALFFIINLLLAFYINKVNRQEAPPPAIKQPIKEKGAPQPSGETKKGPTSGAPPTGGDVPEIP